MQEIDKYWQQVVDFWHLVVEVWRTGLLGVDISQGLIALAIFLGFTALRTPFAKVTTAWVGRLARRTTTDLDDRLVAAIEQPLRAVPLVVGLFFAIQQLELHGAYADVADRAVRTAIAVVIFWALYRMVDPFSSAMRHLERVFTHELVDWLVKAIRIAVVAIGGATILQIWGIAVGPILAGAGLLGVAVALGAQNLFKNLIAGVLILAEKRFHKGDWILVDGVVEGTVESIGFRSSVIRRFDKATVVVPNEQLSDTALTNFTHMTHRRIFWKIGVEYRTTAEQLREIRNGIEAYIQESDDFASAELVPTFVRIDSFGDSSIDLLVYCFTKTTVWGEWLEIKERLAYHIKELVEGAGTGFAFPSRSLYVETMPSEAPETFTPPAGRAGEAPTAASEPPPPKRGPSDTDGDGDGA